MDRTGGDRSDFARRRSSRASIAFGLLAATSAMGLLPGRAIADTPVGGSNPNVTLDVTPSSNLLNGQAVAVVGAGFGAAQTVTIAMCNNSGVCSDPLGVVVTDTSGNFTRTINVPVQYGGTTMVNCLTSQCFVHAVTASGSALELHRVTFAGGSTTTSTTVLPTTTSITISSIVPPTTSTAPTPTTVTSVSATTTTVGAVPLGQATTSATTEPPAGSRPGPGHSQVIAQGMVDFPDGQFAWTAQQQRAEQAGT